MTVRLSRRYPTPQVADRVWKAVVADNPPYVEGGPDGDRLVVEVASDDPASLRATLDDLVQCLAAAERAAGAAARSTPSHR